MSTPSDTNFSAWPAIRTELFVDPRVRLHPDHTQVRDPGDPPGCVLEFEPVSGDQQRRLGHDRWYLGPAEHAGDLHPVEVDVRPGEREEVRPADHLDLGVRFRFT